MKKYIGLICTLAAFFAGPEGQGKEPYIDSLKTVVYFKQESSDLSLYYRRNSDIVEFAKRVNALMNNPSCTVWKISVISGASIENSTARNMKMSDERAEEVKKYLLSAFPSKYASLFEVRSLGQDWKGLAELVEDSDIPKKDSVMMILRDTPEWIKKNGEIVDGRKKQLMELDGGRPWQYLVTNLSPELRRVVVVCMVEKQ